MYVAVRFRYQSTQLFCYVYSYYESWSVSGAYLKSLFEYESWSVNGVYQAINQNRMYTKMQ